MVAKTNQASAQENMVFGKKKEGIEDDKTAKPVIIDDTTTFKKGRLDSQNRLIVEVYGTTKDWVVYRTVDNQYVLKSSTII